MLSSVLGGYLLPFCAMMGVLVAIHEGGHFLMARLLGISVTDFAIGMGPTLLRWQDRSGCVWRLCLLPIGGFVRMRGGEVGAAEAAASEEVLPGKLFRLRPVSHRALVIAAGPAANFLAGFAVLCALYIGVGRAEFQPVVKSVIPGSAAAVAGLIPGDRILAIDGETVADFPGVVRLVGARSDKNSDFSIDRGGKHLHITITPRGEARGPHGTKVGRIGVEAAQQQFVQLAPAEAMSQSAQDIVTLTTATVGAVWETATLNRPISDMGGPIRIAEVSGDAMKFGWIAFISLAAVLSVNLGVMNLLPVPVLDGGHLALLLVERLRGRPPSPEAAAKLFKGGAIALLVFFALVGGSDIGSLVNRLGGGH